MVDQTLRYGAGLHTPRPDLYSNLPELGTQGIRSGLADVVVERQRALDRITGLGGGTGPRIQPPPGGGIEAGPSIYYSPSLDRFSAGGVEFGREDYDVALQAPSFLGQQAPAPVGADWRQVGPTEFNRYIRGISEGRGLMGNLGIGARNVGEGLIGGAGRGLQMLGAEGVGGALVQAGEAIGVSDAERARSAAISGEQSLLGQIGTATVQSAPTIGVSIGAGLAGAAAGAPLGPFGAAAGALVGIAASIFPMELQSSWEAAEQNGLDPTDPDVQTDIIMSTLFKTGVQTVGPAVITRGFSPALRTVVNSVTTRTLGQRIARGVGAGALEGSAEAIAQITDRVVFDPELRAQLNEADIAALAPLVVQRYGEEALVAFGAGFLLGGGLGALGTPTAPRRGDTPPRRDVTSGQPTDMLSGARLDPQATPDTQGELFGGADLGRAPGAPAQQEMFLGQPLGVAPDERQQEMFPDYTIPSQQPGFQMQLPLQAAPAPLGPAETQLQLPLQAASGTQADLFGTTPPFPQAPFQLRNPLQPTLPLTPQQRVAPAAPAGPLPLLPQQRAEPGQAEMFTAPEMGVGPATQARLTGQQLAGATRPAITAPPEVSQAGLEAAGQQRMELTTQPTAMGAQLGPILEAQRAEQNRVRQQAEQAAATRARREAEFTAAQQQAEQQRVTERQQRVDAEVEWEQLRPEGSRVTFDRLTPSAQRQWSGAVSEGTADQALFDDLRRRVRPGRAQPLLETPTPLAEPEAAPAPAAPAPAAQPRGAQRLRRGARRAVQEPSPTEVDVRQQPADGQAVGEGDAQVQEAAQARAEETQQPEVQVVEGRGGRRELEPVAPAEAEAAPEPAPTTAEGVVAEDLAEVDALIEDVETTTDDRSAMQSLTTLVEWANTGTKAAKERASAFITTLESDPTTARQLERARIQAKLGDDISKARGAIEKARAAAAAGKKGATKRLLDAETKLADLQVEAAKIGGATKSAADNITDIIEHLNAGGEMSLGLRSKLVRWWGEARPSDPEYNGRPLTDYISGGPDFFNYGPRVNGHRQIVPKETGTGRPSRTTFNFTGGKFNNLDGSPITRSLPHGRAKMLISNFRSKLKRAPSIKTFTNAAQLKSKDPALYARAAAARPQGDFDNVTAAGYAFGDGEVIVFTDNVANEAHLRFVLAHETMGHYGLRGFIPAADFDKTMESIYNDFPHIQGPVDAAVAATDGLSKSEAVEEYLSDYAALLETNLLMRVWNAVKNALNTLGVKFADDYPRYLINHARRYARRPNRGHFADMDVIAQRAYGVETGAIAPGRYKRSDEPFGTLERVMSAARLAVADRPLTQQVKGQALTDIPNSMEAFKNEFLSLFQFQARKNPGLKRLGEIVQTGIDRALYIRNLQNEVMGPALNKAIKIPGTNIEFGGTKEAETELVNNALAVARIRASQKLRDNPKSGQSKTPIFRFDETTGVFEETGEAERLDALYSITLEEFRDGFTAELKRETGEVQKFTFAGDPTATENSRAWTNYQRTRKAMLEAHKLLLKAKFQANTATVDGALEEIASLMPDNKLTSEQRRLIRKAAKLYSDLYNKGTGLDPQTGQIQTNPESIRQAEEFLQAFNTAIIADMSAATDTDLTNKDSAARRNKTLQDLVARAASKQEADDLVASIENFKDAIRVEVVGSPGKFVSGLRSDPYFIQQKIAGLNAAKVIADGGEQSFRNLIASQYTPIIQDGRYQGRVVPVDASTGEPVALGDAYGGSMGYTQFDTQSEADAYAEQFKTLMLDEDGKPLEFKANVKGPAGETLSANIRFEMRVDEVQTEVTAPLQLNLNEFMLGVMRYSIPLKPSKMEELLTDLTRQDDRARKRLLTEFTAGDPRTGVDNIATHIDGMASTISKIEMRPEIERLMSRRNKRSRGLWDGDPKRVEATRARYERLAADPGATDGQVDNARRDYEEAQMMFNETDGQPNKFVNQAGKVLSFMNGNERLTDSNFDSNAFVARWRSLTAVFQLGASIATAALNPVSVYTNVAPYLATRNAKTAFGGGFGMGKTLYEINRAFKEVGLPGTLPTRASAKFNEASFWDSVRADAALQKKYGVTDFEARMLAQEIRQGSMQPALTNTMSNTARGMATTGAGQKATDGMMFMFNVSEQASRRAGGIAAFRMEFARRMSGIDADLSKTEYDAAVEQAYRDSVKFVTNMLRETLGEYAAINRPNFFRAGIPGMLYMYKIFPTTSIQLFRNMDLKGKAWMALGLWMLGGLMALPFAENIEDLLDTLDQRFGIGVGSGSIRSTVAKELDAIQPGLAKWVLSGAAAQVVPMDVMSRVMLSPLPATEFFLAGTDRGRMYEEILGPMPSAAMGATQAVFDAVRAPFSATITAEDIARAAPITGIRLLADSYAYLNSGAIVDRRGYVVEPNLAWYDIATRIAGFYPASAAEQYSTIRIVNRIANYRREMSAQFRSEWVQASIRGDRGRQRDIETAVREWNQEHRNTPLEIDNFRQGAQRALREARRSATERTLRTTPTAGRSEFEGIMDALTQ